MWSVYIVQFNCKFSIYSVPVDSPLYFSTHIWMIKSTFWNLKILVWAKRIALRRETLGNFSGEIKYHIFHINSTVCINIILKCRKTKWQCHSINRGTYQGWALELSLQFGDSVFVDKICLHHKQFTVCHLFSHIREINFCSDWLVCVFMKCHYIKIHTIH